MKFKFVKRTFVSVFAAGMLCLAAGHANADSYTVDGAHSFIQFRTKHLGYSWLPGQFNKFEGKLTYDPSKGPESQSVSITIDTASLDTNWADRDKHLRSADFFDVEKYPTATFQSTGYEGDASGGKLTGDLTLHGVTKSISFDIRKIGEGDDPWGGYRAGFEGSYDLNREDWGMAYNLGPAAKVIELNLLIEAIKDK